MVKIPNWCECSLRVYGPREILLDFINKAKGVDAEGDPTSFSLNNFVPMPKELENTQSPPDKKNRNKVLIKKYGTDNWYDWRIKNWGCKWDIDPNSVSSNIDGLFHLSVNKDNLKLKNFRRVYYYFTTPWSPPEAAIKRIGKMLPKLKFILEYWEGGAAYQGKLIIKNGTVIEDKYDIYRGSKGE